MSRLPLDRRRRQAGPRSPWSDEAAHGSLADEVAEGARADAIERRGRQDHVRQVQGADAEPESVGRRDPRVCGVLQVGGCESSSAGTGGQEMRTVMKSVVTLVASLGFLLPATASACGACIEDKIAATYDHALIDRAIASHRQVVFVAIEGPLSPEKV